MKGRKHVRAGLLLAAAVALVAVDPAPASAQSEERTVVISDLPLVEQVRIREDTEARESEADRLLEEGRKHEAEGRWERAAESYRRSAELRADDDALGASVYDLAGRAYYFSDKPGRASRMWEESAERALIFGQVLEAAHGYLRAAVSAQESGKQVRASELGWKAYHLTRSPGLTDAQRHELEGHLEVPGSRTG